ncbi:hypothetical protein Ancab_034526 [Ancistrocladus abbreviatus]
MNASFGGRRRRSSDNLVNVTHGVSETGRMGRQGSAIVVLLPKEEAYVDFLVRKMVSSSRKQVRR